MAKPVRKKEQRRKVLKVFGANLVLTEGPKGMKGAVAKISHDLRNILTSAQLFADRIEGSADPAVARTAPR